MNIYDQNINQFKSIKSKHQNQGVLETDLPFLFENEGNKIGILMLHGSEATPCNTYVLGQKMFEKGYTVMGGLLQGHGINPEGLHSGQVSWHDCYNSAAEYFNILKHMTDKVYILGSSFGGALAYIMGIENKRDVAGVIAVSAPTHSDFNPPAHYHWMKQVHGSIKAVEHSIHHLDIPVLIMHGVDDKVVKVAQAFFAFDKVKTEQKKLMIYNKIGHSLGFGSNTDEVASDIDNFIQSYKEQRSIRFEFKNQSAHSVSVAGEFNNWNAKENPMYKIDDDTWRVDLLLNPGNYQYKLVVNQHQWILDHTAENVYAPKGEVNSIVRV